MYKHLPLFLSALIVVLLTTCSAKSSQQISGKTMGTTYNINVVSDHLDRNQLKNQIENLLRKFNMEMSNWIEDSEVSTFNRFHSTAQFKISDNFYHLMKAAEKISISTNGAFDITVSPLIEIWGFGQKKRPQKAVSKDQLDSISAFIGYEKIIIDDSNYIRKLDPRVTINLSAIAKGYAVDLIAEFIGSNYSKDFLVEIGGEIVASGLNQESKKWNVGIVKPDNNIILNSRIQNIIQISNLAVATSGDYINFYEINGKRYSHTIDPTTLYPIEHQLASVTVIAEKCMVADAVATALSVMGLKNALIWLENETFSVYLIQRKDDKFEEYYSNSFESLLP